MAKPKVRETRLSDLSVDELLQDVRSWNNADLRNIDSITPNEDMLRARRKVINEILRRYPRV